MKKRALLPFLLLITILLCSCKGTAPIIKIPLAEPPQAVPESPPIPAYQKPQPPKRFYADIMLGMVPNDKYGRIYPYIGGLIGGRSSMENSPTLLYGFCDASGRIVCDPLYNDVEFIGKNGKGMYLARRLKGAKPGSDWGDYTYLYIAADGSWVEPYTHAYYECRESPDTDYDYITAQKEDGKWGVITLDGKEILPFAYKQPLLFIDGLAPILSADLKTYTYMNTKGEIVTEPAEIPNNRFLGEYSQEGAVHSEWNYQDILNGIDRTAENSGYRRYYIGNGYYSESDSENNTRTIIKDQKTHTFENASSIDLLPNGTFMIIKGSIGRSWSWHIESFDGKILSNEKEAVPNAWHPTITANCIVIENEIFDLSGNKVGTGDFETMTVLGNHFAVIQGRCGGVIDAAGKWLIKVSLLDYLED